LSHGLHGSKVAGVLGAASTIPGVRWPGRDADFRRTVPSVDGMGRPTPVTSNCVLPLARSHGLQDGLLGRVGFYDRSPLPGRLSGLPEFIELPCRVAHVVGRDDVYRNTDAVLLPRASRPLTWHLCLGL